jgi:hypothetical protein
MSFFIEDDKIKQQREAVESSGKCLQEAKSARDEDSAVLKLLSIVRAGKEEHKQIHKLELQAARHLGNYLISKKAELKHGEFTPFLKQYGITTQDASRYSTVAHQWDEIVRKGYTDYSVSTVLYKLKEDAANAQSGDMFNAERKLKEDIASEASGREAMLLRQLNQAKMTSEAHFQEIQELKAQLAEYRIDFHAPDKDNSGDPSALNIGFYPTYVYPAPLDLNLVATSRPLHG